MIKRIIEQSQYRVFSFDWRTQTTDEERDMGISYTRFEKVTTIASLALLALAALLLVGSPDVLSFSFVGACVTALCSASWSLVTALTSRARRIRELMNPKLGGE